MGSKRGNSLPSCASKNPLSPDFGGLQIYSDVLACIALVFTILLLIPSSFPFASLFMLLQHNVSSNTISHDDNDDNSKSGGGKDDSLYTIGQKDFATILFYLIVIVVVYNLLEEYFIAKVDRRLHMSKVKQAKFRESWQLLAFFIPSLVWSACIVGQEGLLSICHLWEGYPHVHMTLSCKFFFVVQLSYWLHLLPELFLRGKFYQVASFPARIRFAPVYLLFISGAYVSSLTHVAILLLLMQYVPESIFHAARILAYREMSVASRWAFAIFDVLFILSRMCSIALAVLTFFYGLALLPEESQVLDVGTGNFNTFGLRLCAMVSVGILQMCLMMSFITFHVKRLRGPEQQNQEPTLSKEAMVASASPTAQEVKSGKNLKGHKRKDNKRGLNIRRDQGYKNFELPEADQSMRETVGRHRR